MPFKLLIPQPAGSLRAAGEGLRWLEGDLAQNGYSESGV